MPAYHSKRSSENVREACSFAILPIKTSLKGPAEILSNVQEDDIIDETLEFFRANVLFRNFDVRGGADHTLVYLTLFVSQCLVKCEKLDDKNTALKDLKALAALKPFPIPGEPSWPLGGLYAAPTGKPESDLLRGYLKQAREELVIRLCDRLFNADGTKNKWWQSFSKRKFMGKEMKE